MTGATVGKLLQTRTSTGQCPTFAYIMKLSRATQDLSYDVPTAYRKITHPGNAPETPHDNGTLGHPRTQWHSQTQHVNHASNQASAAAALMREDAVTQPLHADTSTSA